MSNFEEFKARKLSDPAIRAGYEDGQMLDALIDSLIEKRHAKGMTQTDVARAMGVTQSTVSGIENQDSDPRITTLQRYARAVGAELWLMAPDEWYTFQFGRSDHDPNVGRWL